MGKSRQDASEEQEEFDIPEESESGESWVRRGPAWLRYLADWVLAKFGRKIIVALLRKAVVGEIAAIRMLVALAEKMERGDTQMKAGGKMLAQMLAEEPEWPEAPEDDAMDNSSDEPLG
jgi:hypothetical protein